jgi:hypothetical protein
MHKRHRRGESEAVRLKTVRLLGRCRRAEGGKRVYSLGAIYLQVL